MLLNNRFQLEIATKRITEYNEELSQLCADAGLHGVKATRATENFAWNVRLLKTHLTLMNKTQNEANNIVKQVSSISFLIFQSCNSFCFFKSCNSLFFSLFTEIIYE